MTKPLDVLEGIGEFVEKYTGSNYAYEAPTGEIDNNFREIGEVLGIPIYIDGGERYQTEDLDFPTLADVLKNLVPKIGYEIKWTNCTVCLVVTFNIPLIAYPPIVVCLEKPDCKEKREKLHWYDKPCLNDEDLEELDNLSDEELLKIDPAKLPGRCPIDPPEDPDIPELNPEEYLMSRVVTDEGFAYPWEDWTGYGFSGYNRNTKGNTYRNTLIFGCRRISWAYYWTYVYVSTFYTYEEVDNSGGAAGFEFLSDSCYPNLNYRRFQKNAHWRKIELKVMPGDKPVLPKKKPPQPPSIPSPNMPNDCCDDIKKLLARVEKKVDSLVKVIKPEDFTKNKITIPANWIYPTTSDNPVILEDIPDYLGAIARLFDRRTGAFPQVVKIKDTKPEEEGDQGDSIIVNSAADLQRATLEYLIASQASVGANQIMTLATLQESALTHYIAASMERKVQAIVEYLDFELDEKSEILKMACNPTAEPEEGEELSSYLPKLVKPYEQPIETINWKGGESLKDMLMDMRSKLIYAASAVTETRDPDKVVEQYLQLQRLLRLLNVREIDERLGVKDLKNFFDESEKGFPTSGLPRQFKDKPYGFGPTETPKFARLTSKSKKTKYKKPKAGEKKTEPGDNPNV